MAFKACVLAFLAVSAPAFAGELVTKTFFDPTVYVQGYADETFYISSDHSDLDGVCKRFGYGPMVSYTDVGSDADQYAVIDTNGEHAGYYGGEPPEKNRRIQEIECTVPPKPAKKAKSKKRR